jgi:hypothetical protein
VLLEKEERNKTETLLFTVTFEEHLVVLEAFLTKVESIDLKLCPSKCLFGADETKHLGHLIAHNLLLPAPEKVRAIRDWIEPINVAEVRSFLGLAGYYRHFIRDFAKIGKLLHGLTREHANFTWGEHEKLSMELLKDALCQTQGLTHSNVDPLSRNPVAALPWEIEAGELDHFPKSAAPEFEAQTPPALPTVRMALLVAEDVDSSEGIGNGAITDAEPRTPEEETSRHSETPRDAPSKAREGSPIMRQGRRLHPKRLFSRGGQQGKEYPRSMGCKWCTFGKLTTWKNGEVADALPEEPTDHRHSPLLAALLELGYLEEIQKGLFARGKPLGARSQDQNRLSALALECRTWAREEEYLQLMLKDNQLYRCQDEERNLFWDLSVELVEANRHSEEGCKLHHHFVWTDTDDEDDEQPRGLTVRMIR